MKRWFLSLYWLIAFVVFACVTSDLMDDRQWLAAMCCAVYSFLCWLRLIAMFHDDNPNNPVEIH